MANPYISQITLPSGNIYDIKDAEAREAIASIKADLTGALVFIGISTTAITDGATTSPITVGGVSHTPETGDVVIYGSKEFVWTDQDAWVELGDFNELKNLLGDLAYLDSVSAEYTPAGTISITSRDYDVASTGNVVAAGIISEQTFTGDSGNVSVTGSYNVINGIDAEFKGTEGAVSVSGTVVAEGSVSQPEFTGTAATIESTTQYTPKGTIKTSLETTATAVTSTGNLTHVASVGASFNGTKDTIEVSGSCVPAGTVSKPSITVSKTSGTSSFWTGSVTGENLSFELGSATYLTNASAELDAAPEFEGTNSTVNASGEYTPAGSVSTTVSTTATQISVVGNVTNVTNVGATLEGTQEEIKVTGAYTPAGTVSKPTFIGSDASFTAGGNFTPAGQVIPTFTLGSATVTSTGTFKPTGTISRATFSGTATAVTVNGTVPTAASASFSGSTATITMAKPAASA